MVALIFFFGAALNDIIDNDSPSEVDSIVGFVLSFLAGLCFALKDQHLEVLFHDYKVVPAYALGWISCWGLIFVSVVMLPLAAIIPGQDCNRIENIGDTWDKLSGRVGTTSATTTLILFLVVFGLASFGVNMGAMAIISKANSFAKNVWDIFSATVLYSLNLLAYAIIVTYFPDTTMGLKLSTSIWYAFFLLYALIFFLCRYMVLGTFLGACSVYFFYYHPLGTHEALPDYSMSGKGDGADVGLTDLSAVGHDLSPHSIYGLGEKAQLSGNYTNTYTSFSDRVQTKGGS